MKERQNVIDGKAGRGIFPLSFYLFLSAFCVMLFCTKCSPLYPFQDGMDINCFFTVGKSLLKGKVLYRDIYEHKGLYLYVLYAVFGYLISHTSFIGIFALEVICATIFLVMVHRILSLYLTNVPLVIFPLFAAAIYSSDAFSYGGQTEELALPLLAWGLYTFLAYLNGKYGEQLPFRKVFAAGCFAAILFWMKYTLTGLYLGLVVFMLIQQIRRRRFSYLFYCAAVFLAGFLVLSLPAILYFAVNHALGDLWQVYFYNLIFLYNGRDIGMSLAEYSFRKFLLTLWRNKRFSLLMVFGGFAFLANKKILLSTKLALVLVGVFTVVPIFLSRQYNRYWGEAMAVFAVLGLIPLCNLADLITTGRKTEKQKYIMTSVGSLVALAGGILIARFGSGNVYLMRYQKEDLPQFVFRNIIERENGSTDVSILNYEALDLGMYTVLDVVPDCKYFCECNINLPELYDTQDYYVMSGAGDYIVTLGEMDLGEEYYEEAAHMLFDLEWDGYRREYYLYRHK